MTQAVDPFAQSDGSISHPATQTAGDPFGQPSGGGDYLKPIDLLGCLLLITPVKFEQVPAYRSTDGKMVTRLSADTVVLTGMHKGLKMDAMYGSQKPIVAAAEAAQRNNVPSILGTLRRVPIGDDKKSGKYPTHEAFESALEAWRKGDPDLQFAWILEKFTDGEAQIARDYLASASK